jgi:1-phosphatidylinositol-3-phosphate 5-kinase
MGTPKLSSLDTLFDQEHEHLRAATAKALVSKPNVCLVEKSAASFARDLFYEKQVRLVFPKSRLPVLSLSW